MPELPEATTLKRTLERRILNKKITSFTPLDSQLLSRGAQSKIIGSAIKAIECLGNVLVFNLVSGYYLFAYLRSTGDFIFSAADQAPPRYARAVFEFQGGSKLFFVNPGKTSYFELLSDAQRKRALVNFGAQPLSKKFTFIQFKQILKNKRTSLKNFLTNPAYFLGIGHVYSDEICFQARLHPGRGVRTFKDSETKRLYSSLKKILTQANIYSGLKAASTKINFTHFLKVYQRQGRSCPRCRAGTIRQEKIGSHWAHYCPVCQN